MIKLHDDPFTRDYIMEKHHQQDPNNSFDENVVNVKNKEESVDRHLVIVIFTHIFFFCLNNK